LVPWALGLLRLETVVSMGPSAGAAVILIAAVRARKAVMKDTIAGKFEKWLCKRFEGKASAQEI
jgi:hypothetical protein